MPDTTPKPERHGPGYSQEDWDEVSDSPELTEADFARARPAREVPEVYDLLPKRGRGRPKLADAKVNLTLRLSPDVVEAYRASGSGWQTRMNDVLREGMPETRRRFGPEGPSRALSKDEVETMRAGGGLPTKKDASGPYRSAMSGSYGTARAAGTRPGRPKPKSA